MEFGLPLAPTAASPVSFQYPEVLKEPEWINQFSEGDVAEVNTGQGKKISCEEYRVRLVRSFARKPTAEGEETWGVFQRQYAQLVQKVARRSKQPGKVSQKTGKDKRKISKTAQGEKSRKSTQGRRKGAQADRNDAKSQRMNTTEAAVHATRGLAALSGFTLFGEGDDDMVSIEGSGGERDLSSIKRRREAPTSEAEVEQPEEEQVAAITLCGLCEKEHTSEDRTAKRKCTPHFFIDEDGRMGHTNEDRTARRKRTSLFRGGGGFGTSENEMRALEGARRAGVTFTPSITIGGIRVGNRSKGVRKCVETHNLETDLNVQEGKTYFEKTGEHATISPTSTKVEVHENTQGKCTEVLGKMLGDRFSGEHRQAREVARITAQEDIAVYCCDFRAIGQTGSAVQRACRKRMYHGTTRVLLIARWSETTAHCIGLVAAKRMKMEEWDTLLKHKQPSPTYMFIDDHNRNCARRGQS